mmetsp:Transcript_7305/g.15228  ORF Transcript_7305/g.15228 Transcript_7305/m.15228 type:complete len:287 (+) Transcript_7305:2101-2961(+)
MFFLSDTTLDGLFCTDGLFGSLELFIFTAMLFPGFEFFFWFASASVVSVDSDDCCEICFLVDASSPLFVSSVPEDIAANAVYHQLGRVELDCDVEETESLPCEGLATVATFSCLLSFDPLSTQPAPSIFVSTLVMFGAEPTATALTMLGSELLSSLKRELSCSSSSGCFDKSISSVLLLRSSCFFTGEVAVAVRSNAWIHQFGSSGTSAVSSVTFDSLLCFDSPATIVAVVLWIELFLCAFILPLFCFVALSDFSPPLSSPCLEDKNLATLSSFFSLLSPIFSFAF